MYILLFKVFTLCYIYIGLAIASIVLVAILLDQRRNKDEAKSKFLYDYLNKIEFEI